MYSLTLQFNTSNTGMFIPMVLLLMPTNLKAWAVLLNPPGTLATIRRNQALDVADAITLGNHTRLGNHA
jgi:hypothetical protein